MFENLGGWTADPQFMEQMGSSYLLAHGLGVPVADASTHFQITHADTYKIYVRTRNWTAEFTDRETPGRFRISIDGEEQPIDFGTGEACWHWQEGVPVALSAGEHTLRVHDLTGFDARLDAVLLTRTDKRPQDDVEAVRALRQALLASKSEIVEQEFDLVVIGGGCAGMCAALAAARNGLQVALLQDRKLLGGNNSSEVRVGLGGRLNIGKYPSLGYLMNEFGPLHKGNARSQEVYEDERKLRIILDEPNIRLYLGYKVLEVDVDPTGRRIASVVATQVDDYTQLRIKGRLFADCTGDATPGLLAGADWAMGREARSTYGEPSAPDKADGITLGASVQWYSTEEDTPQKFPDIDWGLEIDEESVQKVRRGQWYWEVGMRDDQMVEAESIRDYGMYVAYSNWSYIKNRASFREEYATARLAWVCHVLGKRESRRLLGEFILREQDLRDFVIYPDGCVSTSWYIDNHEPDPENARRFKRPWLSRGCLTPLDFYPVPFRCFYSRNVENLFMAGRNISVSHLALGTTRVMRTCAMMGEVVGMAAALCRRHDSLPRDIVPRYWDELDALMHKGAGNTDRPYTQIYTLIDTTAVRSEEC
ncbi:FAD-dependent oxidoreductase [Alistipes shahii]|uniref:FAD-dependent oxidoreductase n=1 Tax=Alistipes shahii TaxID=328814 RepID=UPI003FD70478